MSCYKYFKRRPKVGSFTQRSEWFSSILLGTKAAVQSYRKLVLPGLEGRQETNLLKACG